ncbi:MAG: DNA polymerase IV [Candidatus Dormibacteraeota bacterium]|uniref:DNA polymerase IV n=1 Tax=Candidatus Amunia macphersoniae TaxID=3127014 RepID=A0A934KC18_9BACT|nr:DNA polymerase IV [Candidatus Dormibacteraeota bacterium]
MQWPRAIIHVDLDAFYASVEQLRRPELRGRPIIVGGGGDDYRRGVVSAASYEARRYGVHSAMPLARARRLCPQAVVLPVDFAAYRRASREVFTLARELTPQLEPLSLDEAYLDVTGSIRRLGPPEHIAAGLRDRISEVCGLDASCGVATCKLVAKVASDLRKPRGLVVVPPGGEAAFLAPLPLRRLPGLGPAAERALSGLGLSTLGELAVFPAEALRRRLGEHAAASLLERSRGIDADDVVVPDRPKSVSREETFSVDLADRVLLHRRLRECSADVGRQLRRGGWCARTAMLKLRYSDFSTLTRQMTWSTPQQGDTALADAAIRLFEDAWTGTPVRLLGMGVSGIADSAQLDLFMATGAPRDTRLDHALDALRDRFGAAAPRRGGSGSLRDLDFRGEDLRDGA